MVEATAEFLKMLRNSDVSGGRMMRNDIGNSTWLYGCASLKPVARPAFFCPGGKAPMPGACSRTRPAVKNPRHSMPVTNCCASGLLLLMSSPMPNG